MNEERDVHMGAKRSLQGATLVDLLDRVLDKGLVVAGDIVIQLADVELLTIKIRLLVCSVDKAEEIGMDWWRHDSFLSSSADPSKVRSSPKLFDKKNKPQSAIASKSIGKIMREKRNMSGPLKSKRKRRA
jgi:hypothetical protein